MYTVEIASDGRFDGLKVHSGTLKKNLKILAVLASAKKKVGISPL